MKYSIPKELDFYEAWRYGYVDDGSKKLRGYKWLTEEECGTYECLTIYSKPSHNMTNEQRIHASLSLIAKHHPQLAKKHNLQ